MTDTPMFNYEPLKQKLASMGFEAVHPPNALCLTAVALGTRSEIKVAVHFYEGQPRAIEIPPARITLGELEDYIGALERCRCLAGTDVPVTASV